jgi:hypothetical protein
MLRIKSDFLIPTSVKHKDIISSDFLVIDLQIFYRNLVPCHLVGQINYYAFPCERFNGKLVHRLASNNEVEGGIYVSTCVSRHLTDNMYRHSIASCIRCLLIEKIGMRWPYGHAVV